MSCDTSERGTKDQTQVPLQVIICMDREEKCDYSTGNIFWSGYIVKFRLSIAMYAGVFMKP